MPSPSNVIAAAIVAPMICLLSALSLSSLQRMIEWIGSIAHTPQKGLLRQLKPYIKKIDLLFERIFQGNKFEITSTEVLLMAVIVMLICLTIELAEQAKNPKVIVKTAPARDKSKDA